MPLKYSRQRETIKQFLSTRKDHPTADVVYMNVRETFPNISLGTVYRNLTLLADIGEILRLNVGDGVDHFDYNTLEHYHFLCTDCGRILDMEIDTTKMIANISEMNFNGRIDGHFTYFYGKCDTCIDCIE